MRVVGGAGNTAVKSQISLHPLRALRRAGLQMGQGFHNDPCFVGRHALSGKRGDISLEVAEQTLQDYKGKLQTALDDTRQNAPAKVKAAKPPEPVGVLPHVNTAIDKATFDRIFSQLTNYPDDFTPHPKLVRQFAAREAAFEKDGDFEWAIGEALAIGSARLAVLVTIGAGGASLCNCGQGEKQKGG